MWFHFHYANHLSSSITLIILLSKATLRLGSFDILCTRKNQEAQNVHSVLGGVSSMPSSDMPLGSGGFKPRRSYDEPCNQDTNSGNERPAKDIYLCMCTVDVPCPVTIIEHCAAYSVITWSAFRCLVIPAQKGIFNERTTWIPEQTLQESTSHFERRFALSDTDDTLKRMSYF